MVHISSNIRPQWNSSRVLCRSVHKGQQKDGFPGGSLGRRRIIWSITSESSPVSLLLYPALRYSTSSEIFLHYRANSYCPLDRARKQAKRRPNLLLLPSSSSFLFRLALCHLNLHSPASDYYLHSAKPPINTPKTFVNNHNNINRQSQSSQNAYAPRPVRHCATLCAVKYLPRYPEANYCPRHCQATLPRILVFLFTHWPLHPPLYTDHPLHSCAFPVGL